MSEKIIVAISDPEGSGLYNKVLANSLLNMWISTYMTQVKYGVLFDRKESEGTKRRHQVDTVVEGMYVLICLLRNDLTLTPYQRHQPIDK